MNDFVQVSVMYKSRVFEIDLRQLNEAFVLAFVRTIMYFVWCLCLVGGEAQHNWQHMYKITHVHIPIIYTYC